MSEVKLNKAAYKQLMDENIKWLNKVATKPGDHVYSYSIIEVLRKECQ